MLLFTIHYITLLFIKNTFIHYSLGPHYSLVVKFFALYSLSLKILGHYSLIIIPHPDPHIWAWRPSWSCDLDHLYKLSFPLPKDAPHEVWL